MKNLINHPQTVKVETLKYKNKNVLGALQTPVQYNRKMPFGQNRIKQYNGYGYPNMLKIIVSLY